MKKITILVIFILTSINFLIAQTKKDGTPDMRYKANRTYSYPSNNSSNSTGYSGQHLKKDGTPDRRYKENKSYSPTYSNSTYPKSNSSTKYNYTVARDNNGKIKRSSGARHDFMKQTGYPKGRPGYIIDHIVPLKEGGCDCPQNMQWQTKEEAKAKDKWE